MGELCSSLMGRRTHGLPLCSSLFSSCHIFKTVLLGRPSLRSLSPAPPCCMSRDLVTHSVLFWLKIRKTRIWLGWFLPAFKPRTWENAVNCYQDGASLIYIASYGVARDIQQDSVSQMKHKSKSHIEFGRASQYPWTYEMGSEEEIGLWAASSVVWTGTIPPRLMYLDSWSSEGSNALQYVSSVWVTGAASLRFIASPRCLFSFPGFLISQGMRSCTALEPLPLWRPITAKLPPILYSVSRNCENRKSLL